MTGAERCESRVADPPIGRRPIRSRRLRLPGLGSLGPGLVTGAADDDPSGIATYSQAGARFGFTLLWTMVLTYPLMSAVQLISAHIGRVTGHGLARNMRDAFPLGLVQMLVALLLVANAINIGADLSAMGASAALAAGGNQHVFTLAFALASLLLQLFIPYRHYAPILKYLTLSLLSYVAVLFVVRIDWQAVIPALVVPRVPGREALVTIVAVFGTTISPYLFFWQSAQEVEEAAEHDGGKGLIDTPARGLREFRRMRVDTLVGMAFSNLVSIAIIIAAAATLHTAGVVTIRTAADAAAALKPVAGELAFVLFAAGVIGTGFLAVPVLAGSAAFAVGETQGWTCGLEYKPGEAIAFYAVIAGATLIGVLLDWLPVDPVQALFWSAVINGVVAVPLMVSMMVVVSRRQAMGRFRAGPALLLMGWLATAVMAAAAVSMLVVQA